MEAATAAEKSNRAADWPRSNEGERPLFLNTLGFLHPAPHPSESPGLEVKRLPSPIMRSMGGGHPVDPGRNVAEASARQEMDDDRAGRNEAKDQGCGERALAR
jgi:hypothetical protein